MKPAGWSLLLFTLPIFLHAQTTVFLKTYNKGNSGFAVREVNGNAYAVAGGTDFYYNYHWMIQSPVINTNIHFFKTDVNGVLLWEKIFASGTSRCLSTWMEPVPAGGYVLTGHANSELVWPPDSNNIFLLKTDDNGILQWSKYYDTGKDELGFCVRPCLDNGFILSGFHDSAPLSLMGTTHALLVKTDSAGNVSWAKKYQVAVRDFDTGEAFPCVVRQTADSGFVVAGTTSGAHQADVYVFRTDPSGNLLWANSYEHDNSAFRLSTGLDITETSGGDLVVTGSMDKDRTLNQVNYPFIMKLSGSGALLASQLYDSNPVQQFQSGFSCVEEIAGNGYFFTGMGGYGGFGSQAELLKTDQNLNMQWSRVYTWDGQATMGARSARHTSDGGYVFAGKRQNAGAVLMKTDGTGMVPCKNPGVLIPMQPSINVVNRYPAVSTGITAFPFLLTTQAFLVDTSIVCPVTVTTLPVELISFSAKAEQDNRVRLEWTTLSETDNDYFLIERSLTGTSFSGFGLVDGAGTSRAALHYDFTDESAPAGQISYYRLKQVDFNGMFDYSRTVAVKPEGSSASPVIIKPEPGLNRISVFLDSFDGELITVNLYDLTGRCITESSSAASEFSLEMADAPHGLYFITLSGSSINRQFRVVY